MFKVRVLKNYGGAESRNGSRGRLTRFPQ